MKYTPPPKEDFSYCLFRCVRLPALYHKRASDPVEGAEYRVAPAETGGFWRCWNREDRMPWEIEESGYGGPRRVWRPPDFLISEAALKSCFEALGGVED